MMTKKRYDQIENRFRDEKPHPETESEDDIS